MNKLSIKFLKQHKKSLTINQNNGNHENHKCRNLNYDMDDDEKLNYMWVLWSENLFGWIYHRPCTIYLAFQWFIKCPHTRQLMIHARQKIFDLSTPPSSLFCFRMKGKTCAETFLLKQIKEDEWIMDNRRENDNSGSEASRNQNLKVIKSLKSHKELVILALPIVSSLSSVVIKVVVVSSKEI